MRGDVFVSVNVPLKSSLAFIFLSSSCFQRMKTSIRPLVLRIMLQLVLKLQRRQT